VAYGGGMKILLYDMGAFTQNDLIGLLEKQGVICRNVYYHFGDIYEDDFFVKRFEKYLLADDYDFVMSINFFPLVAELCHKNNIRYLSWSYDSPLSYKKYDYFHYETNHIFLFDRMEYEMLVNKGFKTVHHLPLGVNIARLDAVRLTAADRSEFGCDVSLVGQIYQSQLTEIAAPLPAYDRGFLDSIVRSQLLLYGYYFVDSLISAEMIERIIKAHRQSGQDIEIGGPELSLAIAKKITGMEREQLLGLMGSRHKTLLFSRHVDKVPDGVSYRGTARYFTEMPKIFKLTKVNLNPTLKSIRSGIPLRALDILGSGGLLLSNYQHELVENFIPGEDIIVYDSLEDAAEKAGYYIENDDERRRIAANGYRKTYEGFTFAGQLKKIFNVAGV
jgi:spore maturation protein CgeB